MRLVAIGKVKPNPKNPRIIKDDKFQKLVASLQEFPEMASVRPIVCNTDMVILGGNMRFKAMMAAGWKEVPVEIVDWPEDKQAEFVIKDNVSGGEWDWDALANEWDAEALEKWGLDLPIEDEKEKYTSKVESPVYEPKSEPPAIEQLFNNSKEQELIKNIQTASLPEDISYFLTMAAKRHIVFDYEKIAEYYCHATKEVQELMEQSALVIIDFGQAIEQGYVRLNEEINAAFAEDYEE